VLRGMNSDNARKVPADAPTNFIKPRWQKLVMTDAGIDRRYYELCALSELKNCCAGDIWVQGAAFKDFEDYLVPPAKFASLKQTSELPLAVTTDCDQYLHRAADAAGNAARHRKPHGRPTSCQTPSSRNPPEDHAARCGGARHRASADRPDGDDPAHQDHRTAAGGMMDGLYPALRAPEIGRPGQDNLLLTTILADAINLGLTKMAESCPGTTYAAGLAASLAHPRRNLRDGAGRAGQRTIPHPFAEHWGDGTTSSSDGQNFRTGSKAESTGHINPKYGSSLGGRSTPTSPTSTRRSTPRS
jgi:hypothetical protein